VNPSIDRRFIRVITIGAFAAMLGLAGCGRKGPLDLPPSSSLAEPAQAAPQGPGASVNPMATPTTQAPPAFGPNGEPIAPKGPKRPLALDCLLD
jgi:predicted small lipoprotein YifL